jgi:5'-deoxynucleotidase YfbR-like HD superfamily hydrolase
MENEIIKNTMIEFITGTPVKMINVIRFTGMHQLFPESISQHCHQVAMVCWVLAQIEMQNNHPVNLSKLLTNAIFHDIEEVLGSDLNHHFKNFDKEFKKLYEKVSFKYNQEHFYKKMFFKEELSDEVCKYKDPESIEGIILTIADMLQLVGKSIIEIDTGNIEFIHPFWTGYNYLNKEKFLKIEGLKIIFSFFDEKVQEWEIRFGEERVWDKKNAH